MKNHGLNWDKERTEQRGDEWHFGAVSLPNLYSIPKEMRFQYLPSGELQMGKEDTMDCATRGPVNDLEPQFTYAFQKGIMLPENKKFLEDNGYIVDGRVTFSDAFIAILSGTTRQGNSMIAPLRAIREYGLIPKKLLPLESWMTFDDYHNPKRITEEMKDLGLEFAKRFTINFEQVFEVHYNELLKEDMLVVAGFAWPTPIDGVYPKTDGSPNHVWMNIDGLKPVTVAFDNYPDSFDGDYLKNLAPDYDYLDYGYRVFVSKETSEEELAKQRTIGQTLEALLKAGLALIFPTWLADFLSKTSPSVPQAPTKNDSIKNDITPTMPEEPSNAVKLCNIAKMSIGMDASPNDAAPDEYGCAETVSSIIQKVFPDFPVVLSTIELNRLLSKSDKFKRVLAPTEGCIVVSPTVGEKIGHTGIYLDSSRIASNDSRTGKFEQNYTRSSWIVYYYEKKGLLGYIYEPC